MKNKVEIAGVNFDVVTYEDVLRTVESFASGPVENKHMIVTPNPEMIVYSQQDESFKALLNSASLAVPDGIGILWAAYYLSLPPANNVFLEWLRLMKTLFHVLIRSKKIYSVLPERVTGTDLLFKIVEVSQKKSWGIYLLGAAPGVANVAIANLQSRYPQSVFSGSFAGTPAETHEDELCERINLAMPDILFVAYGSPAQEKWIHRNLSKLTTVKVAMGVGGAIDFAAGKAKRAPQFFRSLGLEWLWRLIMQPKRLPRIWRATVVFVRLIYSKKRRK